MTVIDAPALRAHGAPLGGWALADVRALVGRTLRRSLRTPDTLLMGIVLPVVIMGLFVYVFGGAIDTGMAYVDYVVPGIVLLCAGYGASTTAVEVAGDMTGGLMNRFRTLPMRPAAALTGHVVESMVRNAVSTVLVVLVALVAGFRPDAGACDWLATAALVAAYVLALTWIAVCMGIVASSPAAASAFSFTIMFVPYVSSAFVRPETMPRALELVARYQPVTPVTDTVRAWLTGAGEARPWVACAWCAGLFVVARVGAVVLFRRRAR
jgi:ABC-2 type transport system permease protein